MRFFLFLFNPSENLSRRRLLARPRRFFGELAVHGGRHIERRAFNDQLYQTVAGVDRCLPAARTRGSRPAGRRPRA